MIVDSSALVAIIKSENDAEALKDAILDAERPMISAATLVETSIVIDRWQIEQQNELLDELVRDLSLNVVAFTPSMAVQARLAHRRYGKGMNHPAKLNFGDCISYALAKESGKPLLFKGNDFNKTDIEPALKPS